MKKVFTIFVLLLTVSLVSASVSVPSVYADESGSLTISDLDTKSGDLEAELYGPSGDPDGMGTGDGADEKDLIMRSADTSWSSDSFSSSAEYLYYILSMVQLLAL